MTASPASPDRDDRDDAGNQPAGPGEPDTRDLVPPWWAGFTGDAASGLIAGMPGQGKGCAADIIAAEQAAAEGGPR